MSVLACDRIGCENVMCDAMLFGNEMYICWQCLAELEEYKNTWELPITEAEIEKRIRGFMDSGPGAFKVTPIEDREGVERVFAKFTRQCREE